jgi:hypothetical protein
VVPPAAKGRSLGWIAQDEEAPVMKAVDHRTGKLIELRGRVWAGVGASEQAADAARSGVLPDPRPFRPGTENRNQDACAAKLLGEALREDRERGVASVVGH